MNLRDIWESAWTVAAISAIGKASYLLTAYLVRHYGL